MESTIFLVSLISCYLMLLYLLYSIVFPGRRIWPPPGKNSWQIWWVWLLIFLVTGGLIYETVIHWNHWQWSGWIRFGLGLPLMIIGLAFAFWGIHSLGVINSTGIKDHFVESGAYRYSRNPQYTGDILFLFGWIIFAANFQVAIIGLLGALCFAITPLPEEDWLEEQYGKGYLDYKHRTSRFL